LLDAPDAESREEAISKFVDGLASQKHSGFDDVHRLIKQLPVPVKEGNPFERQVAVGEARAERAAETRRRRKAGKA
jgi:hypothetical protein